MRFYEWPRSWVGFAKDAALAVKLSQLLMGGGGVAVVLWIFGWLPRQAAPRGTAAAGLARSWSQMGECSGKLQRLGLMRAAAGQYEWTTLGHAAIGKLAGELRQIRKQKEMD